VGQEWVKNHSALAFPCHRTTLCTVERHQGPSPEVWFGSIQTSHSLVSRTPFNQSRLILGRASRRSSFWAVQILQSPISPALASCQAPHFFCQCHPHSAGPPAEIISTISEELRVESAWTRAALMDMVIDCCSWIGHDGCEI
jgi:hypothetical protein